MRRFPVLVFCCTAALCAARAAEPLTLTLREALQHASEHSAEIALAGLKIEEAAGIATAARGGLFPELRGEVAETQLQRSTEVYGFTDPLVFSGGVSGPGGADRTVSFATEFAETIGPYTVADARLQVTGPLLNLEKIDRYQAARATRRLAELQRDAVREYVLAEAARLYYEIVYRMDVIRVRHEEVRLREERLALLRAERESGRATDLEVRQEAYRLAVAGRELALAQKELSLAARTLRRVIGVDTSRRLKIDASEPAPPFLRDEPEHACALALTWRPDYLASRQAEAAAGHEHDAARASRLPKLDLTGNYGIEGEDFGDTVDVWGIAVSVNVPLWDTFRRSGDIRRARSVLEQRRTEREALAEQIYNDVRDADDALRYADTALEVAREGVALAEAELRLAEDRVEAGSATELDVLAARVNVVESRLQESAAGFERDTAQVAWLRAVGNVQALIAPRAGDDAAAAEPGAATANGG
ncbi:MAG: TolC family protein [Lentisphaerae bacterium]|nr:TolC family protein [Lentisphaerota bacterium]